MRNAHIAPEGDVQERHLGGHLRRAARALCSASEYSNLMRQREQTAAVEIFWPCLRLVSSMKSMTYNLVSGRNDSGVLPTRALSASKKLSNSMIKRDEALVEAMRRLLNRIGKHIQGAAHVFLT